ncbi:MAG TPA: class IV adenylate cyclase, partial [Gemmatimonadales bacterium]|nr:class IV adenylate cyclase [Gemmatimonadales bacterium]
APPAPPAPPTPPGAAAADEIEVKARVEHPEALRTALERAGATLEFAGDMSDRRFDRAATLAARDEVLRLRVYRPATGGPVTGVLGWKGPQTTRGGYRHRREAEARLADPDQVVTILEQLGFTVALQIDRRVEVYRLGDTVLRLEWYPAMDVLLEVEGPPAGIERAIAATGLARERFVPESLPYFVTAYEARTGRPAVLSR